MKTRAKCWKTWCLHQSLTTYARSLPKEITDIFKKKTKDFGYGLLLTENKSCAMGACSQSQACRQDEVCHSEAEETGIKLLIMKTSPKCQTIKLAWIGWLTGECLPKEIGDRSKWTYYKLYRRLKDKYKVNYLCTDGYEAYSSFTLAEKKHTTTKAETSLIESTNFLIRHYLARFQRSSIRFSKSLEYVYYSLLLLFTQKKRLIEPKDLNNGDFTWNRVLTAIVG